METRCLTKSLCIPLVFLAALLCTHLTAAAALPDQDTASSHGRSRVLLKKHSDSLGAGSRDSANVDSNKSSGRINGLVSDTGDCMDKYLNPAGTGSGSAEAKQNEIPSSSSSSLSESWPSEMRTGRKNVAASGTMGSTGGEQLPGDLQATKQKPLRRHSRDTGVLDDRDAILRAKSFVSRMLDTADLDNSAADGGKAAQVVNGAAPDDETVLSKLLALPKLKRALLRPTGPMDPSQLAEIIRANPSLSLDPVSHPAMMKGASEDLGNSFVRGGKDSLFSGPARVVQKRNPNTMSINNAMMAITNMLLAEQKERLQRNRQRIRHHMLIQG